MGFGTFVPQRWKGDQVGVPTDSLDLFASEVIPQLL